MGIRYWSVKTAAIDLRHFNLRTYWISRSKALRQTKTADGVNCPNQIAT